MRERSHLRSTLAAPAALMLVAALLVGTSSAASAAGEQHRVALPIAGGISESENVTLINTGGFGFGASGLPRDFDVCAAYTFDVARRGVVVFGHQPSTGSAHALQLKAHWDYRPSATRFRFVGSGAIATCVWSGVEYSVYVVQAID